MNDDMMEYQFDLENTFLNKSRKIFLAVRIHPRWIEMSELSKYICNSIFLSVYQPYVSAIHQYMSNAPNDLSIKPISLPRFDNNGISHVGIHL